MTNGRQKGSVAEREVAGYLRNWWADVEPDALWTRTPLSGGWGAPTLRAGFKVSGDLATTAKRFPFVVEVKRREQWSLDRVLRGMPSPVWEWWRQTQKAAAEMKGEPMLWFRKSSMPWMVMLRRQYGPGRRLDGAHVFGPLDVDHGEHVPTVVSAGKLLEDNPERYVIG